MYKVDQWDPSEVGRGPGAAVRQGCRDSPVQRQQRLEPDPLHRHRKGCRLGGWQRSIWHITADEASPAINSTVTSATNFFDRCLAPRNIPVHALCCLLVPGLCPRSRPFACVARSRCATRMPALFALTTTAVAREEQAAQGGDAAPFNAVPTTTTHFARGRRSLLQSTPETTPVVATGKDELRESRRCVMRCRPFLSNIAINEKLYPDNKIFVAVAFNKFNVNGILFKRDINFRSSST